MTAATRHIEIPLRTSGGQNARGHYMETWRRNRKEKEAVLWYLTTKAKRPKPPCSVKLTRISPGTRPLDDDNLRGVLKAVRDAVAQWIGIDDGDPMVKYLYDQRRDKDYAVVIEFGEQ